MKRSFIKDSIMVMIIVVIGKICGFARELVVAYLYGASPITDAFYFCNGLINSAFLIITMGMAQAFTPMYLDIKIQKSTSQANNFANKILTILLILGTIVFLILFLLSPTVIRLIAPDMVQGTKEIAYHMLRMMSICIPIYIMFAIRKCILNANQLYFVTEASGIPYSIAITIFTIFLSKSYKENALPIAASIGVLLQFFLVYFFSRKEYAYRPTKMNFNDIEIRQYFILLLPLILNAVFDEANGIIRKSLASGLGDGAVANLNYCMTLTTIINGIIITSISTVFYPHLIKNYSEKKVDEYIGNAKKCLSGIMTLILPLVGFLFVSGEKVVSIAFERGQFSHENTLIVYDIFRVYIIGSVLYAIRYTYRTFFYSLKDTKKPIKNEMVFLILTIIFNISQIKLLKGGLTSLGYGWLLAMFITTPALVYSFKKHYYNIIDREMLIESTKSFISTLCFLSVLLLSNQFSFIENRIFAFIVSAIASVAVYMAMMIALKSRTIKRLLVR